MKESKELVCENQLVYLGLENEIKTYSNKIGDVLVNVHDFWAIVPCGNCKRVIDLGLDAILEPCLRMEWLEFPFIDLGKWERGILITSWARAIHNEWLTLG
jgi:hypothetical protein